MVRRSRDIRTLDLFEDYRPPVIRRVFDAVKIRAASLKGELSKAISLSMKESGKDRTQIAREIGDYLGEAISPDMLNAYASEAREEHVVNVVRFIGLIHATGDARLLDLIASKFGWAVIPAEYLPAIEEALLKDKLEELQRQMDLLKKERRSPR